jgi:hypothetical protein
MQYPSSSFIRPLKWLALAVVVAGAAALTGCAAPGYGYAYPSSYPYAAPTYAYPYGGYPGDAYAAVPDYYYGSSGWYPAPAWGYGGASVNIVVPPSRPYWNGNHNGDRPRWNGGGTAGSGAGPAPGTVPRGDWRYNGGVRPGSGAGLAPPPSARSGPPQGPRAFRPPRVQRQQPGQGS